MLYVAYYDEDKSHNIESDNSCTDIHVNYRIRGAYVFSEGTNPHKKSSTSCQVDICHTVVCINGVCHTSITNATSTVNKIAQNSSSP